jgi:hypothetical protein
MKRTGSVVWGLVAALGLAGAATADAWEAPVLRAPAHEVSVAAPAFADDTGDENCRVARGPYAYVRADEDAADVDCDLVAPVSLPDRARLSSLTCSLYDAEAANAIEAHLARVDQTTGDTTSVFVTPGTVDSGLIQVLTDATAAPGTDHVDNARFTYYVAAAFSYTDFTQTGNAMRVYGCSVRFR